MNKIMAYGDNDFGKAVSFAAANAVESDHDFVVDPLAGNFRTFWGLNAANITMGEISPSVHHAQFSMLNCPGISDNELHDAINKINLITSHEQYKHIHSEYYRRELSYGRLQDVETAVMFLRMAFALQGKLLWGKDGKLLHPSSIFTSASNTDFLMSRISRAREIVKRVKLFTYAPTMPHETVRNAVNTYKEIRDCVDKFVIFTVIPPYQAKKADITALTEKPWLENERNLFMEEVASVLQEFHKEASVFLVMMDVVATHEYLKRWPVKIQSLTALEGHKPYAVFELEKGVLE